MSSKMTSAGHSRTLFNGSAPAISIDKQDPHHQSFGLASFTEDDLAALSRRKVGSTASERIILRGPLSTRSMTPLEECDDESIISDIPTGIREQQEILSALRKENFRLKLSLHSHRRKENLQNAQLRSTSSALHDIESKKNGLEKTLQTLAGDITVAYHNLEKLVSEQPDDDRPFASQEDERSNNSSNSLKREIQISVIKDHVGHSQTHTGPSFAPSTSLALKAASKIRAHPTQRSLQDCDPSTRGKARPPGMISTPTRRYALETPGHRQDSKADNVLLTRSGTVETGNGTKRQQRSPRTNRKVAIEVSNMRTGEKPEECFDPWIIDVHLSNIEHTDEFAQHAVREEDYATQTSEADRTSHDNIHAAELPIGKTSSTRKQILKKISCGLQMLQYAATALDKLKPAPRRAHSYRTDSGSIGKKFKILHVKKSGTPDTNRNTAPKQQKNNLDKFKKIISRSKACEHCPSHSWGNY